MKTAALIVALIMAPVGPSFARPNWQPLAFGWAWSYATDSGTRYTTVQGGTNVRGRSVTELRHETVDEEIVRNYWSSDAAGNVYLHGFINDTINLSRSYEPPVLWIPGEVGLDVSWLAAVDIYDGLDGFDPLTMGIFSFRMSDNRILDLAAGAFDAWGVIEDSTRGGLLHAGVAYALTGFRRADERLPAPTRWHSHGFGIVKDGQWELTGFEPVATTPATWGEVKSLYR